MKKVNLVIILLVCSYSVLFAQITNTAFKVLNGEQNGLKFRESNTYSIRFGSTSAYRYGPVQNLAMKFSNTGSNNGWVFGPNGQSPVVAISAIGKMQISNNFFTEGRLGVGAESLGSQSYIFGGGGWWTFPTLSLRSNSDVNAWALLDLKGGHFDQTGDYMIGRGTKNFYDGRALTIHVPSRYGFYGSSGYYPRIVFASSGPVELGYAMAETGDWYFKGDVGIGQINNRSAKLHVSANSQDLLRLQSNTGNGGNQAGIDFCTYNNNTDKAARIAAEDQWNYNADLVFYTNGSGSGNSEVEERMRIKYDGGIGIATGDVPNGYKLAVKGNAIMQEVKVVTDVNSIPDYVFADDYELLSLEETEAYIQENKHLPEVPSAKEIAEEGGMNLKVMNLLLLKKVEELTLHTIDQQKTIDQLVQTLQTSSKEQVEMKKRLQILENK